MVKERILAYLESQKDKQGITREKLVKDLKIAKNDRHLFYDVLAKMEKENLIARKQNGTYVLAEKPEEFKGVLHTNRKGFGFISVENEAEDDYFVRGLDLHGAVDGDVVIFRKIRDNLHNDRMAASVIRVETRANHRQVGTITQGNKKYFFLNSDNQHMTQRFLISKQENKHLVIGHKVVVVPEEYLNNDEVVGRVIEVLGHENTPGIDILSIVKQHDIPTEFPHEVDVQVESVPNEVDPAEVANRTDLRDLLTITIDGADAKDLDDAISLKKAGNGNAILYVHIADVSHYVKPDSPIDKEALLRGTSVYLADRVIPMLPVQLSNGICSLHPQVDRLTLTCEMEIDHRGLIVEKKFYSSVINSDERMTYHDVNLIYKEKDASLIKKYQHIYPMLLEMYDLSLLLKKRRHENGYLDFDISEAKIIVDKTGKAIDIQARTQEVAEELIEQFMLIANEATASYFAAEVLPFIYRIHGIPKDTKLDVFRKVASNMRVNVSKIRNTAALKPKALQALLETINEKEDHQLLSTLLLRTMQKAEYSTNNIGHFGLAMRNYTHFTSPIRRYPDLIVHRMIRHFILDEKQYAMDNEQLGTVLKDIAHETSIAERRAVDCERAVTSMKMAEYMQDHIGEHYSGIISGVINSGFFVELDNLVEGKVAVESLTDDYYMFVPEELLFLGRRTKKQYRMGNRVDVVVESASKELSEIRFVLDGMQRNFPKGRSQQSRQTRSNFDANSTRGDGQTSEHNKHGRKKNKKKKASKGFYNKQGNKGSQNRKGRR